jgi:hypothetical protein
LRERSGRCTLINMREPLPAELDAPARAIDQGREGQPASTRPTVDEMGEWSFPASDPPATWTWEVERPAREGAS